MLTAYIILYLCQKSSDILHKYPCVWLWVQTVDCTSSHYCRSLSASAPCANYCQIFRKVLTSQTRQCCTVENLVSPGGHSIQELNKQFCGSFWLFDQDGSVRDIFHTIFLEEGFRSHQEILGKAFGEHAGGVHLVSYSAVRAESSQICVVQSSVLESVINWYFRCFVPFANHVPSPVQS